MNIYYHVVPFQVLTPQTSPLFKFCLIDNYSNYCYNAKIPN